jgi:hypothetical protein
MSNITFTTINPNYPVAGVDNDTQGFRDNFSAIRAGLQAAKGDIETLESSAARISQDNNFNGNGIENAKLKATTEETFDGATIAQSTAQIQFVNGHYQKFKINNNVTFTFTDWPADEDRCAKIRIELVGFDNNTRTVRFNRASVSFKILFDQSWPSPTLNGVEINSSTDPVIVEFWTSDNGETIFAHYVGKFAERSYT